MLLALLAAPYATVAALDDALPAPPILGHVEEEGVVTVGVTVPREEVRRREADRVVVEDGVGEGRVGDAERARAGWG
jgi:chloramphenicol 3-O-phosphotransferase